MFCYTLPGPTLLKTSRLSQLRSILTPTLIVFTVLLILYLPLTLLCSGFFVITLSPHIYNPLRPFLWYSFLPCPVEIT